MMGEVVGEVAVHTERAFGLPAFGDERFAAHKLAIENFHAIPQADPINRVAFVDGGQQPIFRSPSLALALQRVAFVECENGRAIRSRRLPQRVEYYALALAVPNDAGDLAFRVRLFPFDRKAGPLLPKESDLEFDIRDRTLAWGFHNVDVTTVLDTVRLFAEWSLSAAVARDELEEGDAIIRDGTLQTGRTNENAYATEAYEAALERGVLFGALSKTSTLFTSTGVPLLAAIAGLARGISLPRWYYHPIVDITHPDHRGEMYAAKFHADSEYIFRFEVLREQARAHLEPIEALLASLADNARDIRFPGYPFGLIDADRAARVGEWEAGPHAARFLSEASQRGVLERLTDYRSTSDAHDRLNEVVLGG